MSRNDQVTRQWLLLKKLESARGVTLQELADSLPEDLSRHPRTIRRDLEALEVRFPLVTEQGAGQTRWRLMDGYRHIPQLAFSPTKLMALVFSRDLLKPLDGTEIKASLDSALNKAAAVLPPEGTAHGGCRDISRSVSGRTSDLPSLDVRLPCLVGARHASPWGVGRTDPFALNLSKPVLSESKGANS